ncbi:lipoprotein-releasing ABC transporter permease subunit [Candidatus Omnitrophota bacterium]
MNWELLVSWRYFKAKRKQRFISLISLISILGIALGVMALIAVTSVMNGFDQELREKIVGINPHILIEKAGGLADFEQMLLTLDERENVVGAAPFINGQALFKADSGVQGVMLRGIDPVREQKVTKIGQYLVAGSFDLAKDEIIIGAELAKRFYLDLGDAVAIISSEKGRSFDFTVAGIFNSGMYEYDLNLVVTNIAAAQDIFKLPGVVGGVGLRLDDLYQAQQLRQELQQRLGYPYWVREWMSMNKNLFSALKLEKLMQFVITALIVVVACFSIVGTLIMMVMEKTKDIGILKAIGATSAAVRKMFMLIGLIIGTIGTLLGALGGVLLCRFLQTSDLISLPKDIYYIATEGVPVQMRGVDIAIILGGALVIALMATIYPAHQAARLEPAEILRYE